MKKFNYKSKLGFTLIELLVVIGILAVLAAIAIPAVAGLIDRANVSADDTNANEMTNSVERFVSEYELFKQDIASGKFDKNKMDSAQGRVYAVTGVEDRAGIEALESTGTADGVLLNIDTKYPVNEKTLKRVVNNYMKTSASTFTPKQSDCSYYYSPALGTVVCAETGSTIDDLSAIVLSYDSASVVRNSTMLATASNGVQVEWMNMTLNVDVTESEWTNVVYATETKNIYKALDSQSIIPPTNNEPSVPEEPEEPEEPDLGIDMSTVSSVLEENSWETIQAVIKEGKINEARWKVGNTKTLEINNQTYTATIIGLNHDGENTATFMIMENIGYHVMNNTSTNTGGWEASDMRDWLNKDIYNSMSNKSYIKEVTKYTNNIGKYTGSDDIATGTQDYVFLLSTTEVGKAENSAKDGSKNTTYKWFKSNTINSFFYLRSPFSNFDRGFYDYEYGRSLGYGSASVAYAAFPAFVIG